jgi:hypothetical protein
MRLSRPCPEELFDLLEVAVREPTHVLKWIIDNCERSLPWEEVAELFKERESWNAASSVLERQSLDGVDIAKAAAVLPRLGWQEEITTDVVIAYVRAGSDDSALELLSASPTKLRNGALIAAHALLTGCDWTLGRLLGGRGEWLAKSTAREAAILLQCAGQPEAAFFLAQLGGEGDDWSAREGDEAGRRIAEKLCAVAGLPEPLEVIQLSRARRYGSSW